MNRHSDDNLNRIADIVKKNAAKGVPIIGGAPKARIQPTKIVAIFRGGPLNGMNMPNVEYQRVLSFAILHADPVEMYEAVAKSGFQVLYHWRGSVHLPQKEPEYIDPDERLARLQQEYKSNLTIAQQSMPSVLQGETDEQHDAGAASSEGAEGPPAPPEGGDERMA